MDIEFEKSPATNDLKTRQNDLFDVHMADEDVSGDLPDVLKEAEVLVGVLKPCQLKVSVHVSAVGVSVSKVPVVVVSVVRHRHSPICANTD